MSQGLDELLEVSLNTLRLRLRDWTEDQLRALLNNDAQLDQLCKELPTVSA